MTEKNGVEMNTIDSNSTGIPIESRSALSGTFPVTARDLEELMGKYKERGSDYQDLKAIENMGGISKLLENLKTDAKHGISSTEHRENDFGSNKVFVEPVPPFCSYVLEALEDLMIRILIVAAIVQTILGCTLADDPSKDWIDGLSIIVAVFVVVGVGSVTNWKKETKFHELNDYQNEGTRYNVIRNGQPIDMKSDDLLVGDLIKIVVGDILPADLLLIEGNGIKMDESSLTGESDTMKKEPYIKCCEALANNKKPASPLMLSGTNCVEGTGDAIVLAVGDHSQKGIIKRTVDNAQENNKTPLEQKLDSIAESIGWFGMGAGIVTLIALGIRLTISTIHEYGEYKINAVTNAVISYYAQNNPISLNDNKVKAVLENPLTNPVTQIGAGIVDIILLCVAIIAVAIPEGLPLAVTLSLAFSIKKLMDQNNLVRKMHACETMGGANYICTDKTGTLTKNEMNVFKVLTATKEITLKETLDDADAGSLNKQSAAASGKKLREGYDTYFPNEAYWNKLKTAIALNIDGAIKTFDKADVNGDTEECETKNKTDKAFIDFLYRFRSPISHERSTHIADNANIKQIPFDSKRKRMTTFIHCEDKFTETGYRLFSKGGAENVKSICKYYVDSDTGETKELGEEQVQYISNKIEQFNKQMLRSLYVCYKDISESEFNNPEQVDEDGKGIDQRDLVFVGVVGIRDSLRNGVKEAVKRCHTASVNVIMVTGDNIITATAIAKDCYILGDDVDLENMKTSDIEHNPDMTNDPTQREAHIQQVLETRPKAITGNTFFAAIGGLVCSTCKEDSSVCKCPKTVAEAEEMAKHTGGKPKEIKNDTIGNKKNFLELIKNLKVMARSQPIHKYALVLGLRELHYVVAVTGDGTNDAPALSKSDVGFSMFAGTDIAKDASDIVILDNNFSSIVVAIIYGRNIYDNIRKFLQFQLTVNFCACLLVFICACVGNETPLCPIQMLWVNLIMDSLGSLALATEPPYEELLNRKPNKKGESIINGKMWKHISIQALVQLIILLLLYFFAPYFIYESHPVRLAENRIIEHCYGQLPGFAPFTTPEEKEKGLKRIIFGTSIYWSSEIMLEPGMTAVDCGKYAARPDLDLAFKEYINANSSTSHMSLIFNIFVIYTLFNQINARIIDDSFNILIRIEKNILFPIITLVELVLQILILQYGNAAFKVIENGLTWDQWLITIGFSAVTFVLSAVIKVIPLDKFIDSKLNKEEDKPLLEDFKIMQGTKQETLLANV